jgi:hypothetical protein
LRIITDFLAAARPVRLRGKHKQFGKLDEFDEKIKSSNYADYTNFMAGGNADEADLADTHGFFTYFF